MNSSDPRWKLIENVAGLLEKTLTPGARVRRDVTLPEIVTGTHRQCDLVIEYGKPPRNTISIVEVQDRSKRVEIGTYEGWIAKRDKLGAQHLICVSISGFPESVVMDAKTRGAGVRLMWLRTNGEPLPFTVPELLFEMDVRCTRDAKLIVAQPIPNTRLDEAAWIMEGKNGLKSFMDIVDEFERIGAVENVRNARQEQSGLSCRQYSLRMDDKAPRVVYGLTPELVVVESAEVIETHEFVSRRLSPDVLAYEQINTQGPIGWAIIGKGEYDGRELYVQVALVSNGSGWRVGTVSILCSGLTMLEHCGAVVIGRVNNHDQNCPGSA